jgi:hypothetical protein
MAVIGEPLELVEVVLPATETHPEREAAPVEVPSGDVTPEDGEEHAGSGQATDARLARSFARTLAG